MLGDHGALVAVQRDGGLVERLLGVLQLVAQLVDTAFEDRSEVARDQRSSDS